jgi:hypothetical protein
MAMAGRNTEDAEGALVLRKSGFAGDPKNKDSLDFPAIPLGQNCPSHCPQQEDELGEPMDIREVATLIGCSVWTIRQRYLASGLPHFRLSSHGKLVFYRNQVIRWVLERQR